MRARPVRNHMVSFLDPENLVFSALADPTRRAILAMISEGSCSVHEIAERFPMSRPAISKHLALLRRAGLLVERRAGRRRLHDLVADQLHGAIGQLQALLHVATAGEPAEPLLTAPAKNTGTLGEADDWRCW